MNCYKLKLATVGILLSILAFPSCENCREKEELSDINMPIIQTKFTADPAPVVHDGVVYLFTTHDEDGAQGFLMKDWLLYTSTDMVNWQDHGAVASLRDFSWYKGNNGAWAEQVIERNGKWYMYCPIHGNGIGVLVADSPYGPYIDPLGKPLIWQKEHWDDIDPTILIDDDGQAYMYWGNPNVYYVKLNEDMISYSGEIVNLPRKFCKVIRRFTSCCFGGSSDAHTACLSRAALLVWHAILIQRDAVFVQFILNSFAGKSRVRSGEIQKKQVVVCTAGYDTVPKFNELLAHHLAIPHDVANVLFILICAGFLCGDCFCSNHMLQRPALRSGEHSGINLTCEFRLTENHAAPRPAKRLVRCRCDDVRITERRLMNSSRDKPSDMSHVNHEERAFQLLVIQSTPREERNSLVDFF